VIRPSINGVEYIVNASLKHGVKRIILVSSIVAATQIMIGVI